MLDYPQSPVPAICISPAPDVFAEPEPESPFACLSPKLADNADDYRAALLSPPPSAGSHRAGKLSPLRPDEASNSGKGLARERFEALLAASRERNASVGAKRGPDLRKEIALKAHKSKQLERRALFLSKVQAPPSPSAADLPKTPPESPAIFHYSLPSPGLVSPLALFEAIAQDAPAHRRKSWVEQVDFRLPDGTIAVTVPGPRQNGQLKPATSPRERRKRSIPSLDEITARMTHAPVAVPAVVPAVTAAPAARRLPSFLERRKAPSPPPIIITPVEETKPQELPLPAPQAQPRQQLPIGVGRLRMPVRATPMPAPTAVQPVHPLSLASVAVALAPRSPGAPKSPKLRVTTTVVPRTSSASPVDLTESNLYVLDTRARTRRDMLSTLRRRAATPGSSHDGMTGHDEDENARVRLIKRHSAPAELKRRGERAGFMHPVLALPGAF